MAEFVQLRKEKWVDTLTWLRKLEIFEGDILKTYMDKIDRYEYKIQSPNRKLEDILAYIKFLCWLLRSIQEQRKVLGQHDGTEEIDRFIYNEALSQFGSAEINYKHSMDLWNARIMFVATIVPEQDRENEFNRTFKKAMAYAAKTVLDFYKKCVDFKWTLPQINGQKRKYLVQRDCSKVMNGVREITAEVLRNLPHSVDALIWVLATELKYLCILMDDRENNGKVRYNSKEEAEKAENLVDIYYNAFKKKHTEPVVFCQLFDAVSLFNVPKVRGLSTEVLHYILFLEDKPVGVYAWLINRSINENKIDECLERVTEALTSCSDSKAKTLKMCCEKLNLLIQKVKEHANLAHFMPKLVQFAMTFYDSDDSPWKEIAAANEAFLLSRIQFLITLASIMEEPSNNPEIDEQLLASIKSYYMRHHLTKTLALSAKTCPTNFFLVRKRIHQLLVNHYKRVGKPMVILKYLSGIDWKRVGYDEGRDLLHYVYRMFNMIPRFKRKQAELLKLRIKHQAMDELKIFHMRLAYLEDIEGGRTFYNSSSPLSSDWKFAGVALDIEAKFSRGRIKPTATFTKALEDVQRLATDSSIEPWKACAIALRTAGRELEAQQLLQRALKRFNDNKRLREDLHLFSISFRNSVN